jgi:hypothetical protein
MRVSVHRHRQQSEENSEMTTDQKAELDSIEAAYSAAVDSNAYEAADAAFFAVARDVRTTWLKEQAHSL